MRLPVTIEDRYQWGDIEGLLWAYATRKIDRLPDALPRDFEWKLLWGRELYEDVIAGSGEPTLEYAQREHEAYRTNPRTLWALNVLREHDPERLLDFGAGVGGQACVFAEQLPDLRDIGCGELTRRGALIGREYAHRLFPGRITYTFGEDPSGGIDLLYRRPCWDAVNAQEVLEHVFDLREALTALGSTLRWRPERQPLRSRPVFIASFPFGDWEAPVQWPNLRQHVRLVLPEDVKELFAGHEILALDQLSAGTSQAGWDCGWTMVAVRYSGRPFGRINMARHWERLG